MHYITITYALMHGKGSYVLKIQLLVDDGYSTSTTHKRLATNSPVVFSGLFFAVVVNCNVLYSTHSK